MAIQQNTDAIERNASANERNGEQIKDRLRKIEAKEWDPALPRNTLGKKSN